MVPIGAPTSNAYVMQLGEVLENKVFRNPTTVVVNNNCIIRNCTWLAGGDGDVAIRVNAGVHDPYIDKVHVMNSSDHPGIYVEGSGIGCSALSM